MRWIVLPVLFLAACGGGDPVTTGGDAEPAPPAADDTAADDAPIEFAYTGLGKEDCTSTEIQEEDEPILIESRCAGFGGYEVLLDSGDHGSRLDLSRDGQALGLSYEDPGWMAEPTSEKIEWRYRTMAGKDEVHALIIRIFWHDSETASNKSTLMVVRIDGGEVCAIGSTSSNTEAREIADDMSKRCS